MIFGLHTTRKKVTDPLTVNALYAAGLFTILNTLKCSLSLSLSLSYLVLEDGTVRIDSLVPIHRCPFHPQNTVD